MELNNLDDMKNIIEKIEKGSIAEELGIEKGDILLSINGHKVKDIIDYKYLISDEYVIVSIEKSDSEIWDFEIEKDYDEDLGIEFTNPLIDKAKSCKNKCLFCFIDQLPKGMRKTLYFKDDDSRLSFLQGNFITLTNMNEEDIERIIKYRISPINISVHTTEPELRIMMLKNKNAGRIYEILKRFNDAGIDMNCQIVLVPNVNDGLHLQRTLDDLSKLYPNIKSVAVVPVGITKFREDLSNIEPYNHMLAQELIQQIEKEQEGFLKALGTRFVFASDEFYVLAKREIPSYEDYEGFPQLENGVGLMRQFYNEIEYSLKKVDNKLGINKDYTIATGTLAYAFMSEICEIIMEKIEGLNLNVVPIVNEFFGDTITVSGLVTGQDLYKQLTNKKSKDGIIIPESMLKKDESIFLDNISVEELEKKINSKIIVSKVNGESFINLLINSER